MNMFNKEKKALMSLLASIDGRVCFTSDLWTSINTDGFITLTAHFVDKDWVLQKRILSFSFLPTPHSGVAIYEKIYALLCEWKVESRILTFTLDNTSSNDAFVRAMKEHLSLNDTLFRSGKYFHIRCSAHVLNLIVRNGLEHIHKSVENVRESIKYVKGSQVRKQKFLECVREASIDSKKGLRQDVPTRWNSTYLMFDSARTYRRAFSHMKLSDPHYHHCPTEEDCDTIERICNLLVPFNNATMLFSGSKSRYPQLVKMARDILTIPLSTVASESAFSTSGRILDQYRSSLLPEVVEALVCTRDWFYPNTGTNDIPLEDISEDVLVDFRRVQESQASTNIFD